MRKEKQSWVYCKSSSRLKSRPKISNSAEMISAGVAAARNIKNVTSIQTRKKDQAKLPMLRYTEDGNFAITVGI
jgi:hypothetical protein